IELFLRRFAGWRRLARQSALSQCLEIILEETSYEAWLTVQPRGVQRLGNVQRLLAMSRRFDQFQRQGLFRFLKFIGAQRDADVEMESTPAAAENAVRLMSIHQSKGLEFPIVVVADLGKRFNLDDLKERMILDEEYGLCPKVKAPLSARVYPSLPFWLAARRQKRETLGEELRLLYVALTRACDRLILAGTAPKKSVAGKWPANNAGEITALQILGANNYLDWLGRWLPGATGHCDWTVSGQNPLLSWVIYTEDNPRLIDKRPGAGQPTEAPALIEPIDAAGVESLLYKLKWRYPFDAAATEPAKTSVSALRRRFPEETDDEAAPLFRVSGSVFQAPRRDRAAASLSAAEVGNAHHLFLQLAPLDGMDNLRELTKEAERLRQMGALSDAEIAALDFEGLFEFWRSDLGRKIRGQNPRHVHRELPFTARMSLSDLSGAGLAVNAGLPEDEF